MGWKCRHMELTNKVLKKGAGYQKKQAFRLWGIKRRSNVMLNTNYTSTYSTAKNSVYVHISSSEHRTKSKYKIS
jgi:hypothetical protein